jgi:hypothetical protein
MFYGLHLVSPKVSSAYGFDIFYDNNNLVKLICVSRFDVVWIFLICQIKEKLIQLDVSFTWRYLSLILYNQVFIGFNLKSQKWSLSKKKFYFIAELCIFEKYLIRKSFIINFSIITILNYFWKWEASFLINLIKWISYVLFI